MISFCGHKHGEALINDYYKMVFILIPKNATQTLKELLRPKGFIQTNYFNHNTEGYHTITVLRNPMSRFISGYAESNERGYKKMKSFEYWNMKESKSRMIKCLEQIPPEFHDEHLAPQSYFLKDINIWSYLCFNHLEYELLPFMSQFGINKMIKANTTDLRLKTELLNNMDGDVFDLINKVYEKDYELFNKHCNF